MAAFVQPQPFAMRQVGGADDHVVGAVCRRAAGARLPFALAGRRVLRRARAQRGIEQRDIKMERLGRRRTPAARSGSLPRPRAQNVPPAPRSARSISGVGGLARLMRPHRDPQIAQTVRARLGEAHASDRCRSGRGRRARRARARRSRAERASGPMTEISVIAAAFGSEWPRGGHRPQVGLWPNTPQKCAGTRIEPPMSLPISSPVNPAASAAAAAARGAARRARGVPRIGGGAVDRVVALPVAPARPARWSCRIPPRPPPPAAARRARRCSARCSRRSS